MVARGKAASSVITLSGRREAASASLTLSARVLACEGGANGDVIFRAIWDVRTNDPKPAPVAHGEYRSTDLRWDGKSEASLAAQLSQAVAGLAGEIAAALKK